MAKGKHAAALFEVINKGKSDRPSRIRTPGWWSSRPAGSASPSQPQPAQPMPAPQAGAGSQAGPDIRLDPDRHEVSLRLSYSAAIIVAFTVLVAIVLAYLVGKRTTPSPQLTDQTTVQTRQEPPQPNVLAVSKPQKNAEASDDNAQSPAPGQSADVNEPQPPLSHTVQDAARRVGLNYVIIQSYKDEKTATEASDFLKQNGIDCTIEKDPPHWAKSTPWYCVMGTLGFTRMSGTEYAEYIRKIKDISKKFAPDNSWKAFNPQGYKWGRQD